MLSVVYILYMHCKSCICVCFLRAFQVWAPNLALADGPDENKLVAVAATKCLTESQDVYAKYDLWQLIRAALDAKLTGEPSQFSIQHVSQ